MLFNRHNSKKNGTPPKNCARGAPPPRADRPATAHYRTHRVSPALGKSLGSPIRQYFPDSARFTNRCDLKITCTIKH